jgi:predicted permease
MLDAIAMDVRQAVRRLLRSPGFAVPAVAILALTLGANTAILSLVNVVYLRTIPASEPNRLVAISVTNARSGQPVLLDHDAFDAFRASQRSFSAMSMYSGSPVFRIRSGEVALDVAVEGVTPDYFSMMGIPLRTGRAFGDREAAPAAVLSARLRNRLFASDEEAIGRSVFVDEKPVTVVGVAAPEFFGLQLDAGADVFAPLQFVRAAMGDRQPTLRAQYVIGRLAPGVRFEEATAEVLARWRLAPASPSAVAPGTSGDAVDSLRLAVEPLGHGFSGLRRQWGRSLLVIVALMATLLAIGLVNLLGLMTTRSIARGHEVAVCLALGVGRPRACWQLTCETVLLSLVGAVLAMPIAFWSTRALTDVLSVARPIPLQVSMTPDGVTIGALFLAAVALGTIVGVVPAWAAVRRPTADALRSQRTTVRGMGRTSHLVLVTQVTLSLVLLVGAGLLTGTLSALRANDMGISEKTIVWTRLWRNPGDREKLDAPYFTALFQRLAAIPGVTSAAFSVYFPAYLGYRGALPQQTFSTPNAPAAPSTSGLAEVISPDFFKTFGIPLLRGREFTWHDTAGAPPVAIVSQSLADRLFPGADALGQRLRMGSGAAWVEAEIVGVASAAPIGSVREPGVEVAFRPLLQDLSRAQAPMAHVQVTGDMRAVQAAYVRAVEAGGHHNVRATFTLDDWFDNALMQERIVAIVSGSAAVLAVLLASLGLYGLLSHAVASRIREMGVRAALGATPGELLRMVVGSGMKLVIVGIAFGAPCAVGVAQVLRGQLYEVTPTDPALLFFCTALIAAVGIASTLVPALRASSIDPVSALRQE